jgi:hypothetical protein
VDYQICQISKMASKIDLVVLNGLNYVIWAPNMETLLKSKGLWQYTKVVILDLKDDQVKFVVDGKKDEAIGVITTYISQEIHFHTSKTNCLMKSRRIEVFIPQSR